MIEYEAFAGNAPALTLYACAVPPEQGLKLLRRQLEDGSWRQDPGTWFWYARNVCLGNSPGRSLELVDLQTELVRQIMATPIGPDAHAVLPSLFDLNSFDPHAPELAQLRDWLVEHAGPGEASLVADVLTKGILHRAIDEDIRAAEAFFQPLLEWLLRNGAAELRSKRRVDLVLRMAATCHEVGADPSTTLSALRYLLVNEGRMPWGRVSATYDFFRVPLFRAIEGILALPTGGSGFGIALAQTAGTPDGRSVVLQFLHGEPDLLPFPRLREVLFRGLFRGEIEPPRTNILSELWSAALDGPFPGDEVATFATADALESAFQTLRHLPLGNPWLGRLPPDAGERRLWGRRLAREAIRIWGLHGIANHPDINAPRVDRAIGFGNDPSFDLGLRDGLEEALALRDGDSPSLALQILREHPDERRAIHSALRALAPHAERRVGATPAPHSLASVRERLLSILHAPWFEPVGGVDLTTLLQGARDVELGSLGNEDKVAIADARLKIDESALLDSIATELPDEEQVALGLIYVVHELVHMQQGIAAKARVTDLRSTGAETTLLHLDLSADHATALILAKAIPRWTPIWLKDLQGRSLVRFPSGPLHTSAARARKAQRHVALRLDYLLRHHHPQHGARLGGGYAFADFGPAGGPFPSAWQRPALAPPG